MINLDFRPQVHWRAAAIPKKDGTSRYLLIPGDDLKKAQRDILDELYHNKDKKIHYCATGFMPFKNTMTGALRHDRETPLIIQIDLHNFFPSFPVKKLMDVLRTFLPESKVQYINEFAVFHGRNRDQIPQGAPTSPYLTNIGMYDADVAITKLAGVFGYYYTRYADDLAFTVRPDADQERAIEQRKSLVAAVASYMEKEYGIALSWKKTLYAFKNSPRVPRRILGITFRKDGLGYNAPKKLRKKARAMVHNLWFQLQGGNNPDDLIGDFLAMRGTVNYINRLRRESDLIAASFDPCVDKEKFDYIMRRFECLSIH